MGAARRADRRRRARRRAARGGALAPRAIERPPADPRTARAPAAGEEAPDPEILANLDLFLEDWEAVVEEGEALDVLAGLDAVRRLDAIEELGLEEPAVEDGG